MRANADLLASILRSLGPTSDPIKDLGDILNQG